MIVESMGGQRYPIRLTYVITDLNIGGVPLHLYRLATRLPPDKFQVRIISLADVGPVGDRLRRAGIPVFACEARSPRDIGALWRLGIQLRTYRPDILHSLLFHANIAARIVGPMAGIPINRIICEIQTAERERHWHLAVDNLTCRLCRCQVGNSPSVVAYLRQHAHIPDARLRCMLGGVDFEEIASARPLARESLGLSQDEAFIIWTGRLDPVKGFEEMLSAFGQVCTTIQARLAIVGEGPYRPTVERLIRENGLSEHVLMLGMRSDVPALLQTADVFLLCSRTEGLPNSLLEAMAAGLPVVATDVAGSRDLISPGDTGVLVRAQSSEEIAKGLLTVLKNREEGEKMGRRARDWIRGDMSLNRLLDRWISFYESVRD
ncbi:MAG: glycosyltransferase [Planctomycetota bacterium]|nr:MAG: glycosyltransferase [Planctomycetota bacterium]